MSNDKVTLVKRIDYLILIFLSIHVISSQLSVAVSSIGLGGLIILGTLRLILDRNRVPAPSTLLVLAGLIGLSYLFSGLVSIDPGESFSNSRRILLLFTFFATFVFIRNIRHLNIILASFFLFTAAVSLIEIAMYLKDLETLNDFARVEYRISYFGYPITNAEIKMLVLLIILPFIITRDGFILNKLWLIISAVIIFFSLYLTSTRSAYLGLTGGLLFLGFSENKLFLISFLIILVCLLIFVPFPGKERLVSIADLNHPSNQNRIMMWETGIKIFNDHPVFGIGDISLPKVYAKYKPIEHHGEGSHMHNNVFQILILYGIFGLFAWLSLMIYIIVKQIKNYYLTKANLQFNRLASASIASMIAFQVSGLTEWNFGDFEFAAVLWFTLGLSFLAQKLYRETPPA